MGYNTNYTLDITPFDEEVIPEFIKEYELSYVINEDGDTENSSSWYSHKEDLTKFSLKYPRILFTLHGVGEESPDVWDLYVKNGKSQMDRPKLVYHGYDEELMK